MESDAFGFSPRRQIGGEATRGEEHRNVEEGSWLEKVFRAKNGVKKGCLVDHFFQSADIY